MKQYSKIILAYTFFFSQLFSSTAHAAVLDPASIDPSTLAGRADLARFLYFLITGPAPGYTLPNDNAGLIPAIDTILGPTIIGGALYNLGYQTCDSIPTTGSTTVTGTDTYVFTFSNTSTKSIPTYFSSGGGTALSKKLVITKNGASFLRVDMNCESSGLTSGYLAVNFAEDTSVLEAYFQKNTTTNAGDLEAYWHKTSGADYEKAAIYLGTDDGNVFDLFIGHVSTIGADEATLFGLKGNKSAGLVQLAARFDNDGTINDATSLATPLHDECINLATNTAGAGCTAVGTPNTMTNGTAWTINAINGMTVTAP